MCAWPTAPPECDLSFKDADPSKARTLSREQVEFFNAQGYLKPFDIFDAAGARRNREYFDRLLAQLTAMNDGRDAYAINGFHTRCPGIYDLVVNPTILDLVQDIIGPDIICWGTHYFCKLPRDPRLVPWHQDASYWPLTPARTVTVWLAIDDADTGNACMNVIPGTHRMGHLKWRESTDPSVLNQEIVDADKLGKPAPFELKAGQISLHADMLAHGSRPNSSDRRRCGLTMRFCPPGVRALNPGWAGNAIICRGGDPTGHWTHRPRPVTDDLTDPFRQPAIGGN